MKLRLLFFFTYALLAVACKKTDEIGPQRVEDGLPFMPAKSKRLLIGCEGNFQFGNASLHEYNIEANELTENIFKAVNNRPIGDVLQSITGWNDTIALVVNNSGKIIFIHSATYKVIAEITGLTSPRYMLNLENGTALVTDLYGNEIYIIDLKEIRVASTVPVYGWAETMVAYGNEVFIADLELPGIYRFDIATSKIIDTILLDFIPRAMDVAREELIVGGPVDFNSNHSKIIHFSLDDHEVNVQSELNEAIVQLHFDSIANSFIILGKTLYKTDWAHSTWLKIHTGAGLSRFLATPDGKAAYVLDAGDYINNGTFTAIDLSGNGSVIFESSTGVAPGSLFLVPANVP